MNWTAITSMITAGTAVAALIFTGLSLNTAQKQAAVAEQGQFTDRYTKAVEQAGKQGDEHLQVRLGGLYALERLAHDSPRDQQTIIEVLSAFIRTTAPDNDYGNTPCPDRIIASDVQTALTILGRRDTSHDNNAVIDLRHMCLGTADLRNANLNRMELQDASLRASRLNGANFSEANLAGTDLFATFLTGAKFVGAKLNGADLEGAILRNADFTNSDLSNATLTRTDLSGADLRGAIHDQYTQIGTPITDATTRGAWW
ncbi:pentapeptide repeat-containing protein [Amycolatopsis regifaucium]|uniref:Pentapeptide repeat-containing protein n=1 Tax=Amycolatopsis regifaucium TaxID=546365 RepID=A0A154MKD0_9PSEU|nr:pentapeptide repeat-containing protein [Amycolatopsis regifaucium]KZB84792.1 hypothetical protein AVL48_31805 [Amycolatopsis regifaucium]OKA05225.1 hypothetical protein ATP06_0227065 [Amycolatopsis regifaucium]SFJ64372.1 Pentapeptide repeat-containing protein [Amycolatopsis regifaucium]